jgi:hypothetical protein
MKIGPILGWWNDGADVPKEQANEVCVHVEMEDDEPILKEDGIVPDAFSVLYRFKPEERFTLLNEGLSVNDFDITEIYEQQIKQFISLF